MVAQCRDAFTSQGCVLDEKVYGMPSKLCNLAGCALFSHGLFTSHHPVHYVMPCFEKNQQHLETVYLLCLIPWLVPDVRMQYILRSGGFPDNPLKNVNPLLEVLYACLKECFIADSLQLHVDRSNLARIIKKGHSCFNTTWLAALNLKLKRTGDSRIKETRLYEACIFYLQQTHFITYGFLGSDPLFPEWRSLYDLMEFGICPASYVQQMWAGRCVVTISNENPPPHGTAEEGNLRGIWSHPPLVPYAAWSVDGSHCGKEHIVYANSGVSKFLSWNQDHQERMKQWPGGHPLRKWHRIGTISAQAWPADLRLDLGPVCGRDGHECKFMQEDGNHPGCKGSTPSAERPQIPFLNYWANALSTWTARQIYDTERRIAATLLGAELDPEDEGTLEIPSGYQSFSSCAPPGSKVVALDLARTFAVHHGTGEGNKFGSVHSDTTVDLSQTNLVRILAHHYQFGTPECLCKLIHVHVPSPCNTQGLLNNSNGCSTDRAGNALEGWRGSECASDRDLAVKLWVTDVKAMHRVMFHPGSPRGDGWVGAITQVDKSS